MHESEVEAPDHNDAKDYGEWHHNYPILNIVHIEHFTIIILIRAVILVVCVSFGRVVLLYLRISVVLFQIRVKK